MKEEESHPHTMRITLEQTSVRHNWPGSTHSIASTYNDTCTEDTLGLLLAQITKAGIYSPNECVSSVVESMIRELDEINVGDSVFMGPWYALREALDIINNSTDNPEGDAEEFAKIILTAAQDMARIARNKTGDLP